MTDDETLRDVLLKHHPIAHTMTGPLSGCRCGQVKLGEDVIAHVLDHLRTALGTLDDATDAGDPRCHSSTPGEFAARWNSRTDEERTAHLRWIQEDADVAQRCRRTHLPLAERSYR